MKCCIVLLVLLYATVAVSQRVTYNRLFTANELQKPPVYPFGVDSCQRFYFSHFTGFDTVLTKAIDRGDTAKYLRFYFSFVIDADGTPYDAKFERISSTQYAKSAGSKTIPYFFADKKYYDQVVKQLIAKMTFWKPGLYNGIPVDCKMIEYIQFWVGIQPPQY